MFYSLCIVAASAFLLISQTQLPLPLELELLQIPLLDWNVYEPPE